ncbi:MAG: GNAT family N-acetyltransferase [Candidatus Cybelea sp.]
MASWFADLQFVIWWGGKPKTKEEVRREYLAHASARQAYIVAVDDKPIGYIQAWSDEPPDGGIDIVLKPEAQGRGLGVDAVRALALHLRTAGWKRMTIDPRAKTIARLRPSRGLDSFRSETTAGTSFSPLSRSTNSQP